MKQTWPGEHRNAIGKRVKQARLAHQPPLSQEDLSGKVAKYGLILDRTAISRIEGQTRYVMDIEVQILARALKKNIAWLFES
jgi:hypothetical protein